jgi:hypothetical protein
MNRDNAVVDQLHALMLRRAAEAIGGEERLAVQLGVSHAHLVPWMQGIAALPFQIFDALLDILLDDEVEKVTGIHSDARRALPRTQSG